MRTGFTVAILGLMVFLLFSGRDRSIDLANALIDSKKLRILSAEEERNLESFMTTFLASNFIDTPVAINERYKNGRINVYIVDAQSESGETSVSKGNAAYVSSSDIIFIESSYFDFGDQKIFSTSDDTLTARVIAPLRVHAFFVLAHELGHRQLHRDGGWFEFSSQDRNHAREIEADDFAIAALKNLYAAANTRAAAGIPGPTSTLADVVDDATPLERISDHFGHSVSFLSDDLFESPFPIMTSSGTHPAFFSRMRKLLERLSSDAKRAHEEEAFRKLTMFGRITAATDYLVASGPIEVEFNHSFQYAYLDNKDLFVVGNDKMPIIKIPLSKLERGKQYRFTTPTPQKFATVRYAWAGKEDETMVLHRSGHLSIIQVNTGKVISNWNLDAQLGDSSCVKQFILPPQPNPFAYATYCVTEAPHVSLIASDGSLINKALRELAADAQKASGLTDVLIDAIQIKSFDLDAGGRPTLIYAIGNQVLSTTLSDHLVPGKSRSLGISIESFPEAVSFQGVRVTPKAVLNDATGKPYYLIGSSIFRKIGVYDAEVISKTPFAHLDLSPSVLDDRWNENLNILSTFFINGNRLIINLGRSGAYLMDFNNKAIYPLLRNGFSAMEEIVSNTNGDWIYYRKYGRRIIIFKEKTYD